MVSLVILINGICANLSFSDIHINFDGACGYRNKIYFIQSYAFLFLSMHNCLTNLHESMGLEEKSN